MLYIQRDAQSLRLLVFSIKYNTLEQYQMLLKDFHIAKNQKNDRILQHYSFVIARH